MFIVGQKYSKKELYEILRVPTISRRGAWDTGYREYDGNIFIFANVGIPGRTGHDYNNYWDGDLFVWEAKTHTNLNQPSIQRMIRPSSGQKNFLFTRTHDKDPFTYEGTVNVQKYFNLSPVKIIWQFDENPYGYFDEGQPILQDRENIYEGAVKSIKVNKYERNPLARRICIDHFGCYCNVCSFDFYKKYGDIGKNYIHVHHIVPISTIRKQYVIFPERDLIPICPNCHSIIHKQIPMLSLDELRSRLI